MDEQFLQTIADQNKEKEIRTMKQAMHDELVDVVEELKRAVLETAKANIEHRDGHETKSEVTNLPKDYAKSADMRDIAARVEKMTSTLAGLTESGSDNTVAGIQELTASIEGLAGKDVQGDVVVALNAIEEELKEKTVTIDNLDDLSDFFFSLEQAVAGMEVAPQVTVEAPEVTVEPVVDISGVTEAIEALPEQIGGNMPQVDLRGVSDELKRLKTVMEQVRDRPIPVPKPSSTVTMANSEGIEDPTHPYKASDIDNGATEQYFGFVTAEGQWYIQRLTANKTTIRYAKGDNAYSTAWTNRTSQTYDYFDVTF